METIPCFQSRERPAHLHPEPSKYERGEYRAKKRPKSGRQLPALGCDFPARKLPKTLASQDVVAEVPEKGKQGAKSVLYHAHRSAASMRTGKDSHAAGDARGAQQSVARWKAPDTPTRMHSLKSVKCLSAAMRLLLDKLHCPNCNYNKSTY